MIAAALCALLLATAIAGLVAWCGPVDPPGPRRSHESPTPTSGGMAILAATCVALALGARWAPASADPRVGWLALLAALAGLMGAADDMLDLPPRTKLLVMIALTLQFALRVARIESLALAPGVILSLGIVASVLGVALWIITLTNAVNFMDGVDGLACGAVILALIGLGAAATLNGQAAVAMAAFVGAAAGLGFLPWNLPAHRLFQGDAGALFSGFYLAGLAVIAANPVTGRSLSPYLVPFAALPMLTDVLLTLLARAIARKPLFDAHREHLYQRWLDHSGGSHVALSLRFLAITAGFTLAGVLNEQAPPGWRPIGFVAGLVLAVAGWTALSRRLRP